MFVDMAGLDQGSASGIGKHIVNCSHGRALRWTCMAQNILTRYAEPITELILSTKAI